MNLYIVTLVLSYIVRTYQSCAVQCTTCSATVTTQCTACPTNRENIPSCTCKTGFYDDGTAACAACHVSCATCTNTTSTTCLTCVATRTYASGTKTCPCSPKFYEANVSVGQCTACHASCLTCSSTTAVTCLTCDTDRTYNSGTKVCTCLSKYYEDTTKFTCVACHASCLTCSSGTASTCLTCGTDRTYNSGTKVCTCLSKYYEDTTKITCVACHYSCLTCTGATSTTCATCPTSVNRQVLKINACPCNDGFYDNGVQTCAGTTIITSVACHYSCATCTGATASTCATCNTTSTFRQAALPSCTCKDGYYDDGSQLICKQCSVSCGKCETIATKCLACPASSNRILSVTTCPCVDLYYDSGLAACAACHYSCQTCSGNTAQTCLTCDTTTNKRVLSVPTCNCDVGFYDDGKSAKCLTCATTCKACKTLATTCTDCLASQNRTLSGSTCNCSDGFFSSGADVCTACNPRCATCSGATATQCLTCDAAKTNRKFASGGSCVCNDGFFDDLTNAACQKCSNSCATCTSALTTGCLTCPTLSNRQSLTKNACPCLDGFYDDGTKAACVTCNARCKTCSSDVKCLSCPASSFRTFNANLSTCSCDVGYYDVSGNAVCSKCHEQCSGCTSTTSTTCTVCYSAQNRSLSGNTCTCALGYYDSKQLVCSACHFSCTTCNGPSEKECLSCDANNKRVLQNNVCACIASFGEDGVALCKSCQYSCTTCSKVSTCTSCTDSALRILTNNACPCKEGTYDDGSNRQCLNCAPTCASCSNNANTCKSCVATQNRTLASNVCQCIAKYYQDGDKTVCGAKACHNSCLTCTGTFAGNCTSCGKDANRVLTASQCTCLLGFFETQKEACAQCHYSCVSCTNGSKSDCLTCPTKRSLLSSQCVCPDGLFDDGQKATCQSCLYSCLTCTVTASTCITCINASLRILVPSANSCQCPNGFYDDGTNLACAACHYSCITCFGKEAVDCTLCNSSLLRLLLGNACPCEDGYYDDGTASCKACNSSCDQCGQATASDCTSCRTESNRVLVKGQCVCATGFILDGTTNQCSVCHFSCATCTGAGSDACDSCDSTQLRFISAKSCLCKDGYFDDNKQTKCQPCHNTCATCKGGERSNCLTCSETSLRTLSLTSQGQGTCPCNSGLVEDGLKGVCISQNAVTCPTGQFNFKATGVCTPCHSICSSCTGSTYKDCTKCSIATMLLSQFDAAVSTNQFISNEVVATGSAQLLTCQNGQVKVTIPESTQLVVTWSLLNSAGKSLASSGKITKTSSSFTVPAYTAQAGQSYTLQLQATYSKDTKTPTQSATQTIAYLGQPISVTIGGGDRSIGFTDALTLQATVFDPNVQALAIVNFSAYQLQWSCLNVVTQAVCVDSSSKALTFERGASVSVKGNTFAKLQTYQFTLTVTPKTGEAASASVTVQVQDVSIPRVTLSLISSKPFQSLNPLEQQMFLFDISSFKTTDSLTYAVQVQYDGQVVQSLNPSFPSFSMSLFSQTPQLNDVAEVTVVGSVSTANQQFPSTTNLKLKINLPPRDCQIQVTPRSGTSITTKFTINVFGCTSDSAPFNYKYFYYDNQDYYKADLETNTYSNALPLSSLVTDAQLITILGAKSSETSVARILVQVQDQSGGTLYVSQEVSIEPIKKVDVTSVQSTLQSTTNVDDKLAFINVFTQGTGAVQDDKSVTDLKLDMLNQVSSISGELTVQQSVQKQQTTALLLDNPDVVAKLTSTQTTNLLTNIDSQVESLSKVENTPQSRAQTTAVANSLSSQLSSLLGKDASTSSGTQSGSTATGTTGTTGTATGTTGTATGTAKTDTKSTTTVEQQKASNDRIVKSVSNVVDLVTSTLDPNQKPVSFVRPNLSFKTALATSDGLSDLTKSDMVKGQKPINQFRLLQTTETTQTSGFYSYRVIQYKGNPRRTEDSFPYSNQTTDLVEMKLIKQTSAKYDPKATGNVKISQPVQVSLMPANGKVTPNQTCINNPSSNWTNTTCKTGLVTATSVTCTCTDLGFFSVVDDVDGLYSGYPRVDEVEYHWYQIALFWLVIIFTIIYSLMMVTGYFKDINDHQKVQPQAAKSVQGILNRSEGDALKGNKSLAEDANESKLDPNQSIESRVRVHVQMKETPTNRQGNQHLFKDGNVPFSFVLIDEHTLVNCILSYEESVSRPVRCMINYSCILISLAMAVYFGQTLLFVRTALVTIISCVLNVVFTAMMLALLRPRENVLRGIGVFLYILVTALLLAIFIAIVAPENDFDQFRDWTIQFIITLLIDNFVFQVLKVILSYYKHSHPEQIEVKV